MGIKKLTHNIWRKLVFWVGDIRGINCFPWVTWACNKHLIDFPEILVALEKVQAGDIGLHRDKLYLSNIPIPGFMKHGWVFTDSPLSCSNKKENKIKSIKNCNIVEAVSEGVLKRSAIYPLLSDYAIILRPKNVSLTDTVRAVVKANKIVGCKYDADFDFDIEEELEHFDHHDKCGIEENLCKWDGGFSCTEVCLFAYFHIKDKLKLERKERRGKMVIIGDDFINSSFEIVWLSKSVTPEVATKLGLHKEGVEMIREYWKNVSKNT